MHSQWCFEGFIKPGARRPQAGAPGFLEIAFVREVSMRVCVCVDVCPPPRLRITSGVM